MAGDAAGGEGRNKRVVATAGVPAEQAGAILTIDLANLRRNYRALKARLGDAECAGVVKADGYGLDAAHVVRALSAEGCRTFFVAHVAEALALGPSVPGCRVFVLNGLPPGSEDACAAAGVTPVLNSLEQVRAWDDAARRAGRRLPAALQIDSGMSRMGLPPAEVTVLAADPSRLAGIETVLVMSHLACADEPINPANPGQLAAFERLRAMLPAAPASLANSSGIFLGSQYHHDLARPGVALYGVNPTPALPNPMLPAIGLHAKVLQTREILGGTGIGYAHAARAANAMRLATISLGYADGWHRRAAGAAFHGETRLPFVGRVSMDSIIIDITALPPDTLHAGDLVELIGPHQSVDDVAALAGTIGYEVLTSLGPRFHRRYVDDQPEKTP